MDSSPIAWIKLFCWASVPYQKDHNRDFFATLRENRHALEESNKAELLELHDKHEEAKRNLMEKQQKTIREMEKAHLDRVSALHEKFEGQLERKKVELEEKRKMFDQKVTTEHFRPFLDSNWI